MKKPYVICHMVMSIDGKVTGDFLRRDKALKACEVYYQINRDYKADAYACGRVTMEENFTNKWYPDLKKYKSVDKIEDYIVNKKRGFYALAFDPHGRLGWKSNYIIDEAHDPGYDNAEIIEIVTHLVDKRYLAYLQDMGISYIVGGVNEINVQETLLKLNQYFNVSRILLEGGSIINGAFMEEDVIDELSLVVDSTCAEPDDKPLFMKSFVKEFNLKDVKKYGNVAWLNYEKNKN